MDLGSETKFVRGKPCDRPLGILRGAHLPGKRCTGCDKIKAKSAFKNNSAVCKTCQGKDE